LRAFFHCWLDCKAGKSIINSTALQGKLEEHTQALILRQTNIQTTTRQDRGGAKDVKTKQTDTTQHKQKSTQHSITREKEEEKKKKERKEN
jgi:hypothetical protein